jgi:D-glycero-alpha-D-manno-heptose 1-phosphate guanylyltransferase
VSCIILAGGLGTRLKPVVNNVPKCFAPISEKTFLEIQLQHLESQGITDFILSLGHMSNVALALVDKLNSRFNIKVVVEKKLLGTGGAVAFALKKIQEEEFIVINGDTYLDGSLRGILRPLDSSNGEMARISVVTVPDISRYGGVNIKDGLVTNFTEKLSSGPGLINAGLYRFSKEIFSKFNFGEIFSIEKDLLPCLMKNMNLYAEILNAEFSDIGIPIDYEVFCQKYG